MYKYNIQHMYGFIKLLINKIYSDEKNIFIFPDDNRFFRMF